MSSRHVRNHRIRRDRLGNDPPLLIIAPSPAADHARDFHMAPSDLRVVTNVVHNVHTTSIHENYDRALLTVIQLCGVKAPLTVKLARRMPYRDRKNTVSTPACGAISLWACLSGFAKTAVQRSGFESTIGVRVQVLDHWASCHGVVLDFSLQPAEQANRELLRGIVQRSLPRWIPQQTLVLVDLRYPHQD
jgi:hypothetical protein